MRKKIPVLIFFMLSVLSGAQTLRFSGNVKDTAGSGGMPNVLFMAIKFKDSTLTGFTRSDRNGILPVLRVPLDTYIVILSHPAFSDKNFLLVPSPTDTAFNFKNVVMPPKSVVLNEIEVLAYRDKSYYKGDTLVFTADSFKTRPNATVEDLLKKLPGMRVDANGKITVQGKEVDQVLVDGDEFFGTDPTVATRNLNATSIENVQVYDKKNESTEDGAAETVKVLNLQMKDDAKKGYFGKVSGASDFQNFYEGEVLANKFKGNRKMSFFGLGANTPKQAFNYGDAQKFGLDNEQQWRYDEESGSWSSSQDNRKGIPQTLKTGFYFNDKIGKHTKVNTDYTYNRNQLQTGSETNTQFFLEDTSYTNRNTNTTSSLQQNHALNMRVIHKIDSTNELTIVPKLRYNQSQNSSDQTDDFVSGSGERTRTTRVLNTTNNEGKDLNLLIKLNRTFRKKDRLLVMSYQPVYNDQKSKTDLSTGFFYYNNNLSDSSLVQKRSQDNFKMEHNTFISYTEPWTKKFKTELSYNFSHNHNGTNRQTYDIITGGDILNPAMSNNFDNLRIINRAGAKLIYDVKKYRATIGTNVRNIMQRNINLTTDERLAYTFNNILPNASFQYRINQGSNFSLQYNSSSQQPDLRQMQPVVDNTDPNRISYGNPDLQPTFSNHANLNYYFYKGVSDINFWSGFNATNTNNQISYATEFDSLGRAVTRPINVDGNYYGSIYMGGGFPAFKRFMKVYINFNSSHSNNVSFVNGVKNVAQNTSYGPGLTLEKDAEKFAVSLEGNYDYNIPKTNLSVSSQQPYYTYKINGSVMVKFPKKFSLTAEGNYVNNGNRTPGYNLNYFILNGAINKSFFKTEDVVVSLMANDILNQNISNERFIEANRIVDTKTQIIRRYFLLRVLWKFNSQKQTPDEDDDY